jgi:hypothetical protein
MPYQQHIITSGNLGTLLWEHRFGIVLGSPISSAFLSSPKGLSKT